MDHEVSLSRITAAVLATGMVAGLATAVQAQSVPLLEPIQCQYWTGQNDPLTLLSEVTAPFNIDVIAVQENNSQTRLLKATGRATVEFEESDVVDEGTFEVEIDATLKATTDEPNLVCANTAKVRGVGDLVADTDDADGAHLLIRDGSKLDGSKRLGTLADCAFNEESCSVHKVKASLRITTQDERSNGSAKYDSFTVKQDEIFEAYEGALPTQGQNLVLLCGCLEAPEPRADE